MVWTRPNANGDTIEGRGLQWRDEGATMTELALELQGEYTTYQDFDENRERWIPWLKERGFSPWTLGQMIFGNHSSGRFRTRAVEKEILAGSLVCLKIEGITPYCPLAIVSGRLDGPPPEAFGQIVFPFEETLDVLARVPEDAEAGTYVFFAQQWEPDGQPAYPGGSLIYPSSVATVSVRRRVDDDAFWNSFSGWSAEDAEEIRQSIRRMRAGG